MISAEIVFGQVGEHFFKEYQIRGEVSGSTRFGDFLACSASRQVDSVVVCDQIIIIGLTALAEALCVQPSSIGDAENTLTPQKRVAVHSTP